MGRKAEPGKTENGHQKAEGAGVSGSFLPSPGSASGADRRAWRSGRKCKRGPGHRRGSGSNSCRAFDRADRSQTADTGGEGGCPNGKAGTGSTDCPSGVFNAKGSSQSLDCDPPICDHKLDTDFGQRKPAKPSAATSPAYCDTNGRNAVFRWISSPSAPGCRRQSSVSLSARSGILVRTRCCA